jgi:cytochrome c oxidase assembly protein subunit 15
MRSLKNDASPGVRRWLIVVYLMILAMVLIGGITRLTGSGLSMVEWRPLMGALPPMGDAEWQAVFAQYQLSPQYQQVNQWMSLGDFQRIFFWEYLHRLFGRLIGVVFFVPWLWFVARRTLRGKAARLTAVAFVLGGLQGLLGWFMVKSGLVDQPEVSHFRLAAHLSLAFGVALYVQWIVMNLGTHAEPSQGRLSRSLTWGLLGLIGLQVVWGAFMAGTRAGYLFSTFPDLNGTWLPPGWLSDPLHAPVSIHTVHRWLGWIVALAAGAVAWLGWQRAVDARQRTLAGLLGGLVAVQFTLGAAAVMTGVSIPVAAAHQGVALLLMSSALALIHGFRVR